MPTLWTYLLPSSTDAGAASYYKTLVKSYQTILRHLTEYSSNHLSAMPVNLSLQSNQHTDFVYMPLGLCDY
jgi:uncharacterized membrane-anchored protein YhcB (DUF1043 family)